MRKKILFACLLLLILQSACRRGSRSVYLNIGGELTDFFSELIAAYPLPAGFTYRDDTRGNALLEISLRKSRWDLPSAQTNPSARKKELQRTFYAPATKIWQDIQSVNPAAGLPEGVRLLPLEDIDLPLKALAWGGLYPDDSQYPLVEKLIITAGVPRGGSLPGELEQWFLSLPSVDPPPPLSWIGAVGDIMPGEEAGELFLDSGYNSVFTDTLPILQQADLMLGNLEAVATEYTIKTPKSFNYKFAPPILGQLQAAGFDYLAFANNHCYDYGETGFRDTLANLKKTNLPTSGTGETPSEAAAPWHTLVKELPVTLLSAGAFPAERNGFAGPTHAVVTPRRAGMLWVDTAGFTAMQDAFSPATFDIIYLHGGRERTLTPTRGQMDIYRRCIDAGADLVLGSHPHALQGMEVYKGKLIVYSLGNFIFPDEIIYRYARVSAILLLGILDGRVKYIKIHAVNMQGPTAALDPTQAGKTRILKLTKELDSSLKEDPGLLREGKTLP